MAIVNVLGGQTVGVGSATREYLWRLDSQAERASPVVTGDRLVTYGGSQKKRGTRPVARKPPPLA